MTDKDTAKKLMFSVAYTMFSNLLENIDYDKSISNSGWTKNHTEEMSEDPQNL